MDNKYGLNIAVVGATGAVGVQMLKMLEKSTLPIAHIKPLASKRSAGKNCLFKGENLVIEEAAPESFDGVDIALFSAGGSVSKALAPEAVRRGAIVIDNTSAFRMDPEVPLVVPEVNASALHEHKGIIANPNCSTIQMVAALEPIRQSFGLKRIIVSTYQAVSGAGQAAVNEMHQQTHALLNNENPQAEILPVKGDKKHYPIAFNAVPQIDKFQDNFYTFEEMKMINETKKIMEDQALRVAATCVRLPIAVGHAESVYIEIENNNVTVDEVRELLSSAPGVQVVDDPENQIYPMPLDSVGKKDVFVGRIRKDLDVSNGLHLWIVSDNLLKGAAWNSVLIAETLVHLGIINA